MKKKILFTIFFCLLIAVVFAFCQQALALNIEGLGGADALTKLSAETGVQKTIGRFIFYILSVVGAFALLAFFYGGFTWIIAAGNMEKINSGKKIMVWTGLGMIIILFSFVITDFLIYALTFKTTTFTAAPAPPPLIVPPPAPAPAVSPECGKQQLAGADQLQKKILDMGTPKGSVYLVYDFLTVPDSMKITCANDPTKILVNMGPTQCTGFKKIEFDCGTDSNLAIEILSVTANTKWCFGLICETAKEPTLNDIRGPCPKQEVVTCPNQCLSYPGYVINLNTCCQPALYPTTLWLKTYCYCSKFSTPDALCNTYTDTKPPVSTWNGSY